MIHMCEICSYLKVKGKGHGHHLAKFQNWTTWSVRDIPYKKMNKLSTFQSYPVTLTFGQGHHLSYHLEGHPIDYILTKVNNITVKSARDIQSQKQQKSPYYHILR